MKLKTAIIKNFRRLENITLELEDKETVFVGPNNSGKTSATSAISYFLDKPNFKIHDFPLAKLEEFDRYGKERKNLDLKQTNLPFISLDLWFSIDPAIDKYSRIVYLFSNLNLSTNTVGINCTFSVENIEKLFSEYENFDSSLDEKHKQSLSTFLERENRLNKFFLIKYSSLKKNETGIERNSISPLKGKKTLDSLLRVDFVNAQRNMQDNEETNHGSKLSAAFGAFYHKNLKLHPVNEEAVRIVEENNNQITEHYKNSFTDIMVSLKKLGFPSTNDRELVIASTRSAKDALKGTTDLFYKDASSNYSLPESYNGLGFKNLVLMAIQMLNFQMQWTNTKEDRPMCHVIIVEEPEVHLHAQVQQTYITNMWKILNDRTKRYDIVPQLIITTHSSHILNSVDFEKVRYFKRCNRKEADSEKHPILSTSEVFNLRDFNTSPNNITDELSSNDQNLYFLNFLKRYFSLTHCDLMFADAAILIEGTAERLLIPAMIEKVEPKLSQAYLTILEVGGAHAQIFAKLMKFLHIPYLVITDIDSVKISGDNNKKKACRANDPDAETSNRALKEFFENKVSIIDFNSVTDAEKIQEDDNRFVTFQQPVTINHNGNDIILHGRTLEETFIYENLNKYLQGDFLFKVKLPDNDKNINQEIFDFVKNANFKKAEFALNIIAVDKWETPEYIKVGLSWLAEKLDKK